MEQEWKIAKPGESCLACGVKLGPGQTYFSALFEKDGGFERRDYCAGCFKNQRPENVYYFWKTSLPETDDARARKPVLDVEAVLDFFRRLGQDETPERAPFRYLLALMLTRKKALRFDTTRRDARGGEVLVFAERRGGETHEVPALDLEGDALTAAGNELARLLGWAPPTPPAQTGEAAGQASAAAASAGEGAAQTGAVPGPAAMPPAQNGT